MTMIATTTTVVTSTSQGLPAELVANARELDDLRGAMKALKEREDVLRASILDFLQTQDVDSATDGKVTVSRSSHERQGIDRTKLEALFPDVLAQVSTKTKVEQVRVKIKG